MTAEEIKKLKMIASNCSLPKVQRDFLLEIISKEEKHGWHDLRKNPNDLPKDLQDVFVYTASNEYAVAYYGHRRNEWSFFNPDHTLDYEYIDCNRCEIVIAWKEVEPFEGGE